MGPLLFLLFINDLPLYTSNVSTDMYADDTTLYDVQTSQDTIEKNLQIALNELHKWCKNKGMVLNSTKTKVMLITTNGLNLDFNMEPLQVITNDKILGVFVDNNLTWNEHIKHISKKIASNIWLLSKMKIYLSQKSIEFSFTSLTYNLTLISATLSGEVQLKVTNKRLCGCKRGQLQ